MASAVWRFTLDVLDETSQNDRNWIALLFQDHSVMKGLVSKYKNRWIGRIIWKYPVLRSWLKQQTTHVTWKKTYTTDCLLECRGDIIFTKEEVNEQDQVDENPNEESEESNSDEDSNHLCGHTSKCNQPFDEPWHNNCCPGCRVLCLNHEFCGGSNCIQNIDIHHGLCMNCEVTYHFEMKIERLTIFDANDECIGCNKIVTRKMMFPNGCGHSFCLLCSKDILERDESKLGFSHALFGCLPCPNGCRNPVLGKQCDCDEYEPIKKKWQRTNPALYEHHCTLDSESYKPTAMRCPICQTKYKRKRKRIQDFRDQM
jgi:hypothetical protein